MHLFLLSLLLHSFTLQESTCEFSMSPKANLQNQHIILAHLNLLDVSGCKVPEPLMKEAYIMRPELSPMVGTGSQGILAFSGHGPDLRF